MKSNQIKTRLYDMVGKVFTYANIQQTIKHTTIDEDGEVFTVETDKDFYRRKFTSAENFLSAWHPIKTLKKIPAMQESIKEDMPLPAPAKLVLPQEDNDLITKLTNMLVSNIEKVQNDAGYINQAHAVNNGVKTIVELQKVKLSVLKEYNKKR